MLKIALLGSTGSIGKQVVNTALRHSDKFRIVSLAANSSAEILNEQIRLLKPEVVALADSSKAQAIKSLPQNTCLYTGENAVIHAITQDCDIVFVAMSGFAGLRPTLEAIEAGKNIALANKETLVAGGEIVMRRAKEKGVKIIPVDSEHSAIFQCLNFNLNAEFEKLIITASGGAFRNLKKSEIEKAVAADALKHPNWQMGKKITIDCATLLNKGLEIIEACRLYSAPLEKVEAIIHPESIIHSMVRFADGAVMAQLGYPSMEIPIQLALTYPERLNTGVPPLDLAGKSLTFGEIDGDRFPCFSIALDSFKKGDNYPCAMNAANEISVAAYLKGEIGFYDISDIISKVVEKTPRTEPTYDNLVLTDAFARKTALSEVKIVK